MLDWLLKGSSSIWCMCKRLFRCGIAPHFSQQKPRSVISDSLCRSSIEADGRRYSLPCLYKGLSSPCLNWCTGGFFRFASDSLRRLSSSQVRRRLFSAICSDLDFAASRIFKIASDECGFPRRPCPLTYLFHFLRSWLHSTGSPHPHAHKGGGLSGSTLRGDGFPLWLWPWIYLRPGLTSAPQPQSQNLLSELLSFMPTLYNEYEIISIGGER